MKIPVQEKIAELEKRISALEKKIGTTQTVRIDQSFAESPHWKGMWAEFSHVMREVFHANH